MPLPLPPTSMAEYELAYEGMPDLVPPMQRSEGKHVSEIIMGLCKQFGYYQEDIELTSTWAQLGCALEDTVAGWFEREHPGRYLRIGELERDGIYGTPDFVDLETGGVEETKLSWMGPNHDPHGQKFWRYWAQVKAYCWMLETGIGRLHVCHVNGGKGGVGPVYRIWQPKGGFSKRELAENWAMLKSYKKGEGDETSVS